MSTSVNVARVKRHISILQEELRVAHSLADDLSLLRECATASGIIDVEVIDRQLRIVKNQSSFILQRITWLESMSDKFFDVKKEVSELLEDVIGGLSFLDNN